jgi:nucleoside 2-deoxyribosyltransferase
MLQDTKKETCPICGDDYCISKITRDPILMVEIECERCGEFKIEIHYRQNRNRPWEEVRHLYSAWIRQRNKAGLVPSVGKDIDFVSFESSEWWRKRFANMGFPETINDKLDQLLLAYADDIQGDYQKLVIQQPHFIADIAAKNMGEIEWLTSTLEEQGFLKIVNNDYTLKISAKGWQKIDELRKATTLSNSAFVAMWFSDETTEYREAVIAAIGYCGYKPVIVDQQEYNDFIMDQVRSLIRQARFLVADFTSAAETIKDGKLKNGVRGGVYWEAGMAYGLDKPVIHTCKDDDDSKNRLHFDVSQYNTIFWKDDQLNTRIRSLDETRENPTFAEKLAARIMATIGKGTYTPS